MRPTLITVAAAVLSLAACGTTSVPSSAGSPAAKATASPMTCLQQYQAWRKGPARGAAKKLVAALKEVSAAGSVEDIPGITAALKKGGKTAVVVDRYPMPRCADPAGYWPQLLARVRAAGDNAGAGSGLSSLLLAEMPLKAVPNLERKLSAEVHRTTGFKGT